MARRKRQNRNVTEPITNNINDDGSNNNNTGGINKADLARMITDQITAAIPAIAAQLKADSLNNGDNGSGGSSFTGENGTGCSYKSFISCNPPRFGGTEGATGVIQWIAEIESVVQRSGCTASQTVMYVAGMFLGPVLTWWNSIVYARGRDYLESMTWADFKKLVIKKFCPSN
jgi:hypothetical protein